MILETLTGAAVLFIGATVRTAVPASAPPQVRAGLVVESVVKGRQAGRIGMRPGDILYRWSSGAHKGVFESPFDPPYIAVEWASRNPVVVYGTRGGKKHTWIFNSDSWSMQTRPNFQGPFLSTYLEALQLAERGNALEALRRFKSCMPGTDPELTWLLPWFQSRVARILTQAEKWEESYLQLKNAIDLSSNMSPVIRFELIRLMGVSLEFHGDLTGALQQYAIMRDIARVLDLNGLEVAASSLMLASVEQQRDDLAKAAIYLDEASSIAKRIAPRSLQMATILEHLGILAESRSDLENAQRNYADALRIEERYFPRSRQLASTLTNLGTVAHWRGDFERAEAYHRKSLLIAKTIEHNGPQIAEILNNMGDCLLEEGYLKRAAVYQTRALRIQQRETPKTLAVASTLSSLGEIARKRRQFETAEDYFDRAIAASEQANASEQETAQPIIGKASVLRDKREYRKAEALYRRALAVVERSTPGSMDHAEILADLASALAGQGQLREAAKLYRESLNIIDTHASHLGGLDDDRARYRSSNLRFVRAYSEVLLQQGLQAEAFEVIEGARARTLLELLARGHINPEKAMPPSLLRRIQELQQKLQEMNETRIRVVGSEHTPEQLQRVDSSIDVLSDQKNDAEMQMRLNAPEYSVPEIPKQLSLAEIQKLLDEETLLLEYSLDDHQSYVWAVTSHQLVVCELPPKDQIESAGRDLYRLLIAPPPQNVANVHWADDYQSTAHRLTEMVLRPVAGLLEDKRLVVVADGVLQYLPFAALSDPAQTGRSIPLIVKHEIINLPSASVLAQIRLRPNTSTAAHGKIAIMADPVFDTSDGRVTHSQASSFSRSSSDDRNNLTRSAADLGLRRNGESYFSRLIYTRKEAEAVASVFSRKETLEALDFEASRSTIVSGALAEYKILHLATHGLLNSRRPELSGLVLSLVNRRGKPQDGFLTLQDIYELKLNADLVVLSGCETALGKQINGEGLVGLTRGFMYAGANRVIASLWSVSDAGTAELMASFYKQLQRGVAPAAALRSAQIWSWQHTQWRSPYYWAAFQIQGDWR